MVTTEPRTIDASSVLQPGAGLTSRAAYLPADPTNVLWGRLPARDDKPVTRVGVGDSLVIDTISHEGLLEDQGSDPTAYFGRFGVDPSHVLADAVELAATRRRDAATEGPHVITGPIAIDGTRPGDLLSVRVDNLEMRAPYGVISTRHGRGVLTGHPLLDDSYGQFCSVSGSAGSERGSLPVRPGEDERVSFPLAPFLGIMGVATDTADNQHSTPPGLHGGNIDLRRLTVGATLFLPVQVPDALFYVGDPHFAQGNGEVALTAFEAPLRATLTFDVIPAEDVSGQLDNVTGPFAAGHGLIMPTGLAPALDDALRLSVANAVELLVGLFGMDERSAYLYLSAAADFQVSQAVDLVRGVHGEIRVGDFAAVRSTPLTRRIVASAR